jgi:hypothetical protein
MKKAQFTKLLTVPLQTEVFSRIKQITDEEEIGMAQWARAAIDAALGKIKKQEDAMS